MKTLTVFFFLIQMAWAQIPYTDLAQTKYTKEQIFSNMDRSLIKLGDSICSNRALMWLYDFKKDYDVEGGKIFLFFTSKTGKQGRITWWYHVSPTVLENNQEWVMDAGFSFIQKPLSVKEWLKAFTQTTECKEIQDEEKDLIALMHKGLVFPEVTEYGKYDCYYKKVEAGLWTPNSVAMSRLGVDAYGNTVDFKRPEIEKGEVRAACLEAVTNPVGRILGMGKKRCQKFLTEE
jgi:hypothetical protein